MKILTEQLYSNNDKKEIKLYYEEYIFHGMWTYEFVYGIIIRKK